MERFGADTARLFIMFASPPEQTLEWSDEGVQGAARFIRKLWNAVYEHVAAGAAPALEPRSARRPRSASCDALAHQALAKATDDIGRRRNFNTAIAAIMELLNSIGRFSDASAARRAVRHEALEHRGAGARADHPARVPRAVAGARTFHGADRRALADRRTRRRSSRTCSRWWCR